MSEDNVDQPEDAIDAEIVELIEHDIDALVQERDEFKDIALRLQADFENYKKRVTSNMSDEVDRATGRIADSLLPVLDDNLPPLGLRTLCLCRLECTTLLVALKIMLTTRSF